MHENRAGQMVSEEHSSATDRLNAGAYDATQTNAGFPADLATNATPSQPPGGRRRKGVVRNTPGVDAADLAILDGGGDHHQRIRAESEKTGTAETAEEGGEARQSFPSFAGDLPWSQRSWLYELLPFRGLYYDIKRRAPYYWSDWSATFHPHNWYTVAKTVVTIYFIK